MYTLLSAILLIVCSLAKKVVLHADQVTCPPNGIPPLTSLDLHAFREWRIIYESCFMMFVNEKLPPGYTYSQMISQCTTQKSEIWLDMNDETTKMYYRSPDWSNSAQEIASMVDIFQISFDVYEMEGDGHTFKAIGQRKGKLEMTDFIGYDAGAITEKFEVMITFDDDGIIVAILINTDVGGSFEKDMIKWGARHVMSAASVIGNNVDYINANNGYIQLDKGMVMVVVLSSFAVIGFAFTFYLIFRICQSIFCSQKVLDDSMV